GLIGAFNDLGVPEDRAHLYVEGVRRGGTVLTARVPDELVGEVSEILRRHRAVDIEERAAQWRQDGWAGEDPSSQSALHAGAEPTAQPSLDMDDGGVVLRKRRTEVFSSAPGAASLATYTEHTAAPVPVDAPVTPAAQGDTTVIKVNSRYSPKGKHGQKYLAAGVKLSMRLWEDEQPGKVKPATQREYET